MQNRYYTYFLYIFITLLFTLNSEAQKIKFATVAPRGTVWVNTLEELNAELKAKTQNRVSFLIYPGGVAGDENDTIRKIRYGRLHAGAFTGVGMGLINNNARLLDMPFLMKDDEHVNQAHNKLFDYLNEGFLKKGFRLLALTEIGWTYIFTQNKPENKFKNLKIWSWNNDKLSGDFFSFLNIKQVSLSIGDVKTSLKTGMIDSFYAVPLSALALQWDKEIKYIVNIPFVHSSGAILISEKIFQAIDEQDQKLLTELTAKHINTLNKKIINKNKEALKLLNNNGIEFIAPDNELRSWMKEKAEILTNTYSDKVFSRQVLESIHK